MSDSIDDAQAREQLDRELAIQAQTRRIAESHAPRRDGIDGVCIDCGEPIEPERLAVLAGKTSRCAQCAHDDEQRMKGYRR